MDGIEATRRITTGTGSTPPRRPRLTDRESEVLTLVGKGLSNTEIAGELSISVATAKTYLTPRLLAKLDARDRFILAYEAGLVTPSR